MSVAIEQNQWGDREGPGPLLDKVVTFVLESGIIYIALWKFEMRLAISDGDAFSVGVLMNIITLVVTAQRRG